MSSLPNRPLGSGLPSRPSARDDRDRSPPRRGSESNQRRGPPPSAAAGDDYSDWRGPPGSRPPPNRRPPPGRDSGDRDRDFDRGAGDRYQDSRYDRSFQPSSGGRGSGSGPRGRPYRGGAGGGGRGRSRSRSWSPPPRGARDRSRSPSRSPPTMRGGPGSRGGPPPRGGWDGPRYSRDRSPPSARRRSPSPAYRPPPARSPPPSHRQFGSRASPEAERRTGRLPPASRDRSPPLPHPRDPLPSSQARAASRPRSPTPPPVRSTVDGPPIHPSRMAIVQQVDRPASNAGSDKEEGEVDVDMQMAPVQPPKAPGWGRGAVPIPPQEQGAPSGPRPRFGGHPSAGVPAPRVGGTSRGGRGGAAAYADPSPSPVRQPSLGLPSAPAIPTGPKAWSSRPSPSTSTSALPPLGPSPRPPPAVLQPTEAELAAIRAAQEKQRQEEAERREKMAKEQERNMLKAQVGRWLLPPPTGLKSGAPKHAVETEAELVTLRQTRLSTLLGSHQLKILSIRKIYNDLGLAMGEREVAGDRLRCAEVGSSAAMSRSSSLTI